VRTACSRYDVKPALQNEWHDCFSSLWVVAELLLVVLVLFDGPVSHGDKGNAGEQAGSNASSGHGADGQPADGLEEVVGARQKTEAISLGNSTDASTFRSESTESEMGAEIGNLCEDPDEGACQEEVFVVAQRTFDGRRAGSVFGTVDIKGKKETAQKVIMRRIPEDVHERHGTMREAMHKYCFQFTLEEVKKDQGIHELLDRAVLDLLAVEEFWEVVNQWVNEERATIFNQEYCPPANLTTQVLHRQFTLLSTFPKDLQDGLLVIDRTTFLREMDPLTCLFELRELGRDTRLDTGNGRVVGALEGQRETIASERRWLWAGDGNSHH